MNYLRSRQRGISITGWIVIIAIALFFAMLGMKLIPSYMEYYSIKTTLNSMKDEAMVRKMAPRELRTVIKRRFKINSIYNYDYKNDLKITKNKGRTVITVDYEVRKPMVGNITVLMDFHEQVEL